MQDIKPDYTQIEFWENCNDRDRAEFIVRKPLQFAKICMAYGLADKTMPEELKTWKQYQCEERMLIEEQKYKERLARRVSN